MDMVERGVDEIVVPHDVDAQWMTGSLEEEAGPVSRSVDDMRTRQRLEEERDEYLDCLRGLRLSG